MQVTILKKFLNKYLHYIHGFQKKKLKTIKETITRNKSIITNQWKANIEGETQSHIFSPFLQD